jgi:hypothetical protein
MKTRHVLAVVVGAALILWTLASCDMLGVSIAQRVSDFQADLNTTSRTNVYQNFLPGATADALKDPVTSGFNTTYPLGSYSLSLVDSSNSSAVIVKVSGPHATWSSPYFLSLNMATYNGNDWRIVNLSDSQTNGGYTLRY